MSEYQLSFQTKWCVLFACNACQLGIIAVYEGPPTRQTSPHAFPTDPADPFNGNGQRLVAVYPYASASEAPAHVPDNIRRFYLQGADNVRRGNWDAAGTMFRKAVDIATKVLDPDGVTSGTLEKRIDRLATKGAITNDLQDWAHEIRALGNDAAHEEEPFEEDEAKTLYSFAELFLTYVFTLPGTLAARRASPASTP